MSVCLNSDDYAVIQMQSMAQILTQNPFVLTFSSKAGQAFGYNFAYIWIHLGQAFGYVLCIHHSKNLWNQ